MLNLYLCLAGLVIIFLGFLTWVFFKTQSFGLMLVLMMGVLSLTYVVQPDMWHWYQHESDEKRIQKAQSILKDPTRVQQLLLSLKQHVQKDPKDARAWFLLGRILASSQDWGGAKAALQHAYQLEPYDIKTALFYVETLWHVQGHLSSKARLILQEILKKEPHQPDALMLLATEARQRNCPKEALDYLQTLRAVVVSEPNITQSIDEAILQLKAADNSQCLDSSVTSKH